jgi:hypothetical protein
MPTSKWFVVSNCRLPELHALASGEVVGDLHVYHRGLTSDPPSRAPFEIEVGTLAIDPMSNWKAKTRRCAMCPD